MEITPAVVLRNLNRAVAAKTRGVLLQIDGNAEIANVGHMPPYADGHELQMEAGLPLGIAAGVEYAEPVTRGERFTFVSDNVVEAANANGELFGFDRTREMTLELMHTIINNASKAMIFWMTST